MPAGGLGDRIGARSRPACSPAPFWSFKTNSKIICKTALNQPAFRACAGVRVRNAIHLGSYPGGHRVKWLSGQDIAPGVDPLFRYVLIPGTRPDSKRGLPAGTAMLATQRAFEIEQPGESRPAAHQQLVGNGRLVPTSPAGSLDQVPGAQVFESKIVARRLAHEALIPLFANRSYIRTCRTAAVNAGASTSWRGSQPDPPLAANSRTFPPDKCGCPQSHVLSIEPLVFGGDP